MSYILVAKPENHKILFENLKNRRQTDRVHELELTDSKNNLHTYRNSWVTDLVISSDNVAELVRGGRARWKIENETFNTLKNQGYHIEHNFGHGKEHLSMNFFQLNLLAFFVHQILEMTDKYYQQARLKFSARKEYWNQLRCTFRILLFNSWEDLLIRIIGETQPP